MVILSIWYHTSLDTIYVNQITSEWVIKFNVLETADIDLSTNLHRTIQIQKYVKHFLSNIVVLHWCRPLHSKIPYIALLAGFCYAYVIYRAATWYGNVPLSGASNIMVRHMIWGKHAWLLYFAQMWSMVVVHLPKLILPPSIFRLDMRFGNIWFNFITTSYKKCTIGPSLQSVLSIEQILDTSTANGDLSCPQYTPGKFDWNYVRIIIISSRRCKIRCATV